VLIIHADESQQPTGAFVLLGLTNSVFHRPVRCSAFCPGLTITIEQQNKISTLVLRSAAVAGGDDGIKPPTAQMPERKPPLFRPPKV
jgi:hypothetical protein